MLRIAAGQSRLGQERKVSPSVHGRAVVPNVRRKINIELQVAGRNKAHAFAVVDVPRIGPRRRNLPHHVGTDHLEKFHIRRHQRRRPRRLLALNAVGLRRPPGIEIPR